MVTIANFSGEIEFSGKMTGMEIVLKLHDKSERNHFSGAKGSSTFTHCRMEATKRSTKLCQSQLEWQRM